MTDAEKNGTGFVFGVYVDLIHVLESEIDELTNLLASREADLAHVEGQTEGDG